MAWELSEPRRAVLRALVDTFVPSLPRVDDATGFWATSGSQVGAHLAVEQTLAERGDPVGLAGLEQVLDAMGQLGIVHLPREAREAVVRTVANLGPDVTVGVALLRGLSTLFAYGMPDENARNPFWAGFGYPGPATAPPRRPRELTPLVAGDADVVLDADVCVVGSGAGGGVVAGTLARQGRSVVVLEAGGYLDETDFNQLELWAYQNLYWRGGPTPTADSNVSIMAGATLGGGTTVNWTNCVDTPAHVRAEWEREHGLEGLAGPDFDRHIDTVMTRVGATDACSDLNGPHLRMKEAASALGWAFHVARRNTDPTTYDPATAGYLGFGDQSGSKLGTMKTYLKDAADHGARIVVHTRADRVLMEGGRAVGVVATVTDPATGRTTRLTVRAADVVVACGALETPALLLRSGIGGPAVGLNLHLHPSAVMFGIYADNQDGWWGAPQTAVMDEFAAVREGYGFLVEGAQYAPGLLAAYLPWRSGEDHKRLVAAARRTTCLIAVCRDRGAGTITIDANGDAVVRYALSDDVDRATWNHALEALATMHRQAGALEIHSVSPGVAPWRRGDDLEDWLRRVTAVPPGAGGQPIGCAHQMGTARMGSDPQISVADPSGRLHDVAGVWIADTSAFPTASGANPMLTCMALAHRTAEAISGVRDTAPASVAQPVG